PRHPEGAQPSSVSALPTSRASRYFASGEPPRREGNHHATIAPYGTFATRDGHLNLAVGSDAQFKRFCETLQAPELLADARFATNAGRQSQRAALTIEIERRLTRRSTGEWLARNDAPRIPAR